MRARLVSFLMLSFFPDLLFSFYILSRSFFFISLSLFDGAFSIPFYLPMAFHFLMIFGSLAHLGATFCPAFFGP